jgi:cyanophycinase-like exopeptidase
MTPVFALFGSGEFLPWAADLGRALLERGPRSGTRARRVLIIPTASAPEGDAIFGRWAAMGIEHYRGLGHMAEVLPLKVRDDAERPDLVDAVGGASLIFFSGGNPAYLVRCLKATPLWAAVEAAVGAGCVLAGASAGISFLGATTFDPAAAFAPVPAGQPAPSMWVEGMGLFPRAIFGPHWDAVDRWRPGAATAMLQAVPEGCSFLGIDEDTAAVGDGIHWQLWGRGTATVVKPGELPVVVAPSGTFDLDLGYSPAPSPEVPPGPWGPLPADPAVPG